MRAFHGEACLSSTTTTMLSTTFPGSVRSYWEVACQGYRPTRTSDLSSGTQRNEAWNKSVSDWFEVTSANLNLGAYSLRVRPLPRFLKHPLRKVSGLAIRPRIINKMGKINCTRMARSIYCNNHGIPQNCISTLQFLQLRRGVLPS